MRHREVNEYLSAETRKRSSFWFVSSRRLVVRSMFDSVRSKRMLCRDSSSPICIEVDLVR